MNLDWIKYNLLPALMGVVFLAVIGYGGWGWYQSYSQNQQLGSAILEQEDKIRSLSTVPPGGVFPSPQNLAIIRKELKQLEELYMKLESVATKSVNVPKLTPVQFVGRRSSILPRLRTAAQDKHVLLPDQFTFGFTKLGVVPPASEVPVLTKQLIVTDTLCSNLFACGIQKLDAIDCDTAGVTTNGLYRRTPFTLKFICKTETLRKMLNNLQTMEWLFSIRSLQIEGAAPITPTGGGPSPSPTAIAPGSMFAPGGMPPGFPMPPAVAGRAGGRTATPVVPAPITSAPVAKPGSSEPLPSDITVTMRVDLLEFIQPFAKPLKSM